MSTTTTIMTLMVLIGIFGFALGNLYQIARTNHRVRKLERAMDRVFTDW